MRQLRTFSVLTVLAALSSACFAAGSSAPVSSPQGQAAPAPGVVPAQGLPGVCLDVQSTDSLTKEFADSLREAIAASGALTVASTTNSCSLQFHIPGNVLRFETAGGVMVGTAVIVTSSSGHYLSTSVTACQASDLKPCAVRAVAAAKLALLVTTNDGT